MCLHVMSACHVCLLVSLFVCFLVCLLVCLHVCLSIAPYVSVCLPVQRVNLSLENLRKKIHISPLSNQQQRTGPCSSLSVCLSVRLSVSLSVCLSLCLSICPCLPICLFVCLSVMFCFVCSVPLLFLNRRRPQIQAFKARKKVLVLIVGNANHS